MTPKDNSRIELGSEATPLIKKLRELEEKIASLTTLLGLKEERVKKLRAGLSKIAVDKGHYDYTNELFYKIDQARKALKTDNERSRDES